MAMVEPTPETYGFPPVAEPKLEIIATDAADLNSVTFVIHGEDHTLGNSLRYMIMKNPAVEFCGYSIPHPSEFKIHLRIQTDGTMTAAQALDKGLDDLVSLTEHVLTTFEEKVAAKDDYEVRDGADFETV
ncbi:DNA-directed RNA polymerase [Fimicolochytrium jonesii]|uniref:DNA-directed RNA polymerase n=1 Tax=Fimicolochytrium jonesii TaxID=1396493 RepID=UPI0022FE0726|nr:DNA-directed RNA polymerase [Fimicolochytrium jonesii]KAI8819869.1 DNA-directed RNA polymerase [Fimicolochytrium jonesii]